MNAIVVGATSGIGREVAILLARSGYTVGVAGRRTDKFEELLKEENIKAYKQIDITVDNAEEQLLSLADELGGMDLYFHSSGIGWQNNALDSEKELKTMRTNGEGFVRMVTAAFRYFERTKRKGHIAVISSIAGTKGLGSAPAYSATKRMQNTYIQSLDQLAHMKHLPITFTDIRPGFVDTALISGSGYPLQMKPEYVARRIVKAVERKKHVAIIDWRYSILVFFWQLIPSCIWRRLNIQ